MNSRGIIDTHQHLLYPQRFPYSWTHSIKALSTATFGYDEYCAAARGSGIGGTIFMETAPDDPTWRGEAEWVDGLSNESASIIRGIVANCRPELAGFDEALATLSRTRRVVGLRRILHVEPDAMSQSELFIRNIRTLAARNLTFDLCVLGRQISVGQKLVEACGDVQFILDHCGVPDIASGDFNRWRADISAIAKCPNLACKISGLPTYANPGATAETLRPYVNHVIEAFGFDRLVWGSDWPVVNINSSLPAWMEMTRHFLREVSGPDQAKIFHGNAAKIYRIQ